MNFLLARAHLNPGGLVVANIIGSVEGSGSKLFRSFYRTYRSVFPSVAVHPVGLQGDIQSLRNIIVIAGNSAPPSREFSSTAGVNSRALPTRPGPARADPDPLREGRADARRPGADGRLRADRRADHRRLAVT